jgi:hypothetical protein
MRTRTILLPFAGIVVLAAVGMGGCGGSAKSSSTKGGAISSATTAGQSAVTTTSSTQVISTPAVITGLQVKVPPGWAINEDNPVNFVLNPPGDSNDFASIWLNMRAVKSTGSGHGTTVLTNVGTSPGELVRWFKTNPALRVLASPTQASISDAPMTTLVIGVSPTARYGDPSCPANPHCADVFANTAYQHNDWYGIGGRETVRLFLGHTSQGTVIVGLDATDPTALKHLEMVAKPFLAGIRFPR